MSSTIKKIKTPQSVVYVGENIYNQLETTLNRYKQHKIFLLVDENTFKYCAKQLITNVEALQQAEIIEIESGEEQKNIEICYQIWKTLTDFKADRKSLFVNLGGGVICDMGGFIASTFKRGIDFINIPTTLLSQVDASVGGKVGVDFEGYKNQIGGFVEPKAVFVSPFFLNTLSKRQILSGYAETFKHGLIADKKHLKKIIQQPLNNFETWTEIITESIKIKNTIVTNDPKENGERKKLNFGHTIGHALESYSLTHDNNPLLHGEAIAIGMICEMYLSNKILSFSKEELDTYSKILIDKYIFPTLNTRAYNSYINLMLQDKKNSNGVINFTLLNSIGNAVINQNVDEEIIIESLNYFNSLC